MGDSYITGKQLIEALERPGGITCRSCGYVVAGAECLFRVEKAPLGGLRVRWSCPGCSADWLLEPVSHDG